MIDQLEISSDEITLKLSEDTPAAPSGNWLRTLHYDIYLTNTDRKSNEKNYN